MKLVAAKLGYSYCYKWISASIEFKYVHIIKRGWTSWCQRRLFFWRDVRVGWATVPEVGSGVALLPCTAGAGCILAECTIWMWKNNNTMRVVTAIICALQTLSSAIRRTLTRIKKTIHIILAVKCIKFCPSPGAPTLHKSRGLSISDIDEHTTRQKILTNLQLPMVKCFINPLLVGISFKHFDHSIIEKNKIKILDLLTPLRRWTKLKICLILIISLSGWILCKAYLYSCICNGSWQWRCHTMNSTFWSLGTFVSIGQNGTGRSSEYVTKDLLRL